MSRNQHFNILYRWFWSHQNKSGDQTSISGLWLMITNQLFAKRKWRELIFFRCLFWHVKHCTRHKYIFLFESCYGATKLILLSSFLRGEILRSKMAQNISKWWGRDLNLDLLWRQRTYFSYQTTLTDHPARYFYLSSIGPNVWGFRIRRPLTY